MTRSLNIRGKHRPPEDSAESRAEIAELNRSYWCGCSKEDRRAGQCSCTSPMTNDDVWLLINEGYGLTDIAMMFGISRERVRQKAARIGLEYSQGTKPRVWDERLGRFRFRDVPEQRAERRLRRRVEIEHRLGARRAAQVAALRALRAELGRTPTTAEVAERCDLSKTALYVTWGYTPMQKLCQATPTQAMAALYAAAGLVPRRSGWPGHVNRLRVAR
jgi:hypothetical protein